ncbi:MAG: hypothetical protein KDA96_11205 [Planctomycetaceae bacterium]|nr:hypothetical protein [Planctomycetaceae bacterium]
MKNVLAILIIMQYGAVQCLSYAMIVRDAPVQLHQEGEEESAECCEAELLETTAGSLVFVCEAGQVCIHLILDDSDCRLIQFDDPSSHFCRPPPV